MLLYDTQDIKDNNRREYNKHSRIKYKEKETMVDKDDIPVLILASLHS